MYNTTKNRVLLILACCLLAGFYQQTRSKNHPFYPGSCFILHDKVNKVLLLKKKWMWVGNITDLLPNTANPIEIGVGKKRWINIERIDEVIHMDNETCKKL